VTTTGLGMQDEDTTIITCVEAGGLEDQVVLLADSLRQFGGRRALTPIVAVKPRPGAGLRRTTLDAFDRLHVTFVEQNLNRDYAWWAHANKPAALNWGAANVTTPWLTWLDSDLVFLREPDNFVIDGSEFVARPGEAFDVASTGSDDRAIMWRDLCARHGLDFEAFPDITSFPDGRRIKAYWQAGVFTFRREGDFAGTYQAIMHDLLSARTSASAAAVYHTDQIALALAVQKAKLHTAQYHPTMNLNLNRKDPSTIKLFPANDIKIVHYHGSFWPADFEWAMVNLADVGVPQRELIARHAPFTPGSAYQRFVQRLFHFRRKRVADEYMRSLAHA
jgi:hypothetical protein